MPSLLDTCGECAQLAFDECDDIVITADFTNAVTYYWEVTDQQNNIWKGSSVASGTTITIDVDLFPDGLFSPATGALTVVVKTTATATTPRTLVINTVEYDCVLVTFESAQALEA